jgi:hypothetical protein
MANVDRSRDKISTELSYEKELLDFCWNPAFDEFAGATADESAAGGAAGDATSRTGNDECGTATGGDQRRSDGTRYVGADERRIGSADDERPGEEKRQEEIEEEVREKSRRQKEWV